MKTKKAKSTEKKQLLARRALRQPFVITVAGAGVIYGTAACGGTVADECPEGMACNPPASTCPQDKPSAGSDCPPDLERCEYDDCMGTPSVIAECKDGAWQVTERSCNPPPVECPATEPTPGAACDSSLQECNYGDCYGSPTTFASCVDGKWAISDRSCNPPPVECPAETPTAGAACDASLQDCSYGDCYGSPTKFASCVDGKWDIAEMSCNPPAVECPAETPTAGAACDASLQDCGYGDCYGSPTTSASCVDGTWQVSVMSCNPPMPPPCPDEKPSGECFVEAQKCNYGDCAGSPTIFATCTDGTWSVVQRSCNPPMPPVDGR